MIGGNRIPSTWTREHEEQIKRLWEEEGLSAGYIASLMGRTRNAVIGKIHRLGLTRRKTGNGTSRTYRSLGDIKPKRPVGVKRKPSFNNSGGIRMPPTPPDKTPQKLTLDQIIPLNGTGVSVLDSQGYQCKAVIKVGNPASKELAYYCGHPVRDGESYCGPHYDIFHQPPRFR